MYLTGKHALHFLLFKAKRSGREIPGETCAELYVDSENIKMENTEEIANYVPEATLFHISIEVIIHRQQIGEENPPSP